MAARTRATYTTYFVFLFSIFVNGFVYFRLPARPYVYITPGYTVKEGEEARIQCTISGKPRPTVQWYKDGKTLPFQSNDRLTITPKQISIKSVKLEDQGKYYCRATNKNGVTTGYTMLDILPGETGITRLNYLLFLFRVVPRRANISC